MQTNVSPFTNTIAVCIFAGSLIILNHSGKRILWKPAIETQMKRSLPACPVGRRRSLVFKNHFFETREDIRIYTIYFNEMDTSSLIAEFEDDNSNNGNFALRHNLLHRVEETENPDEEFIGFDFIGVEGDGSFHSFYCHDITKILLDKFDLKLNEFGLFENITNAKKIKEYLNDQETGLEPVPWYIVKTKRVKKVRN